MQTLKVFQLQLLPKIHPIEVCFWSLSTKEKGNQWQLALEFFETMKRAHIFPDIFSFSAAMSACKETAWEHAVGLFDEMSRSNLAAFCLCTFACNISP